MKNPGCRFTALLALTPLVISGIPHVPVPMMPRRGPMASEGPDSRDHSCLWDGSRAELAWLEVILCPLVHEAVVAARHQNHVDLRFIPNFSPINYDSPMCSFIQHYPPICYPFLFLNIIVGSRAQNTGKYRWFQSSFFSRKWNLNRKGELSYNVCSM